MYYDILASLDLKICIMRYGVGVVLHLNNAHCFTEWCILFQQRIFSRILSSFALHTLLLRTRS